MLPVLGALLAVGAAASPVVRAGVLGELLVHPGLFATLEQRLGEPGVLAPVLGARTGAYVHPGHHTALFVHGEGGVRWSAADEVHTDVLLGAGIHHRWLPTRVVVRRGEGLATVVDAGRPSLLGTLGVRVSDADGALRPFGRLDVAWRGPVHGLRTEIVLALGVAFGEPA